MWGMVINTYFFFIESSNKSFLQARKLRQRLRNLPSTKELTELLLEVKNNVMRAWASDGDLQNLPGNYTGMGVQGVLLLAVSIFNQ